LDRTKPPTSREHFIAYNFMKYCKPYEYVYAQYGFPHVFRNSKIKYRSGEETFIDFINRENHYKDKSLIIQFMPWQGIRLYFPLLDEMEIKRIRPIIENQSFPQLVDFREMESVKGCFDFAIIVED